MKLGPLIDKLAKKRAEIEVASNKVKKLQEDYDDLKKRYIEAAQKEGVTAAKGSGFMATVIEKVVPQVVDWEKFQEYIYANRFIHLLQRRPSTPGCTELFALGEIPGVEKFTKVDVSLRSI